MNTGHGIQFSLSNSVSCRLLANEIVYVASLVAHLLLFFVLIGLDIVKTLPRCYLKLTSEELFLQKKHRQRHRIPLMLQQ